jgi:hypothetical protein
MEALILIYLHYIEITYPGSFHENFFHHNCRNFEVNGLEMEYGTDVQMSTAQ